MDELTENKPIKKKTLFRVLKLILLVGLGGGLIFYIIYFFVPIKKSYFAYPWDTKGSTQLSCKSKLAAVVFPDPNFENKLSTKVTGQLLNNDKTSMAITIKDKTVEMLTTTSVEYGMSKPAVFVIIRDDGTSITAVDPEQDVTVDPGVNTFILNKKSGYAVWTKSKPEFFTNNLPDVQAYYLECR